PHSDRADQALSTPLVTTLRAFLSVHTHLLELRRDSTRAARVTEGWMACDQAYRPVPSVEPGRARPCSVGTPTRVRSIVCSPNERPPGTGPGVDSIPCRISVRHARRLASRA